MQKKHKIIAGISVASILCLIAGIILYLNQPPFYDNLMPGGTVGIVRHVEAAKPWLMEYDEIPTYNPSDSNPFQINLCGLDLSNFDLVNQESDISFSMYDSTTIWPDKMPEDFDPSARLETGKNPGLGIRALHSQGINGTGTSIAIIDRILFTEHEQYRENLVHYEEMHVLAEQQEPEMHGAAVSSLAVGKDIGVAPGAKLYYIAVWPYDGFDRYNLSYYADAIDRVISINKTLPENEKIRVISISDGFQSGNGKNEMLAAIERAKGDNIFVITTSISTYYDFSFAGLDRNPEGKLDELSSYRVGIFEQEQASQNADWLNRALFLPMDSRTYASCVGESVYEYGRVAGLSWSAPYLAGLYTLVIQVDPHITTEEFLKAAIATSDKLEVENLDGQYTINHIANPTALIQSLQSEIEN